MFLLLARDRARRTGREHADSHVLEAAQRASETAIALLPDMSDSLSRSNTAVPSTMTQLTTQRLHRQWAPVVRYRRRRKIDPSLSPFPPPPSVCLSVCLSVSLPSDCLPTHPLLLKIQCCQRFLASAGQNIAFHAPPTAKNSASLIFAVSVSLAFFLPSLILLNRGVSRTV